MSLSGLRVETADGDAKVRERIDKNITLTQHHESALDSFALLVRR
jgi:hypothetical protein